MTLNFSEKVTAVQGSKIFHAIVSQSLDSILIELYMVIRLVGLLMKLMLILSCAMNVEGKEPYKTDFI